MAKHDKAAAARRTALEALKEQQARGRRVFKSAAFRPEDRRLLIDLGYLQEVMRGWVMTSSPRDLPGDTTPWQASFWQFVGSYLDERFGDDWVLAPEQSLSLLAENTAVPRQLLVHSSQAQNNMTKLLHGTSIFDNRSKAMPTPDEKTKVNGLWLWKSPAALARVPEHYFSSAPTEAAIALRRLRTARDLLEQLLDPPKPVVAGRLVGALSALERPELAEDIASAFEAARERLTVTNPFSTVPTFGRGEMGESALCQRIRASWAEHRNTVIAAFNARSLPSEGKVDDQEAYMAMIDEIYTQDAYHSLSIEGYEVTDEVIQRVASPGWDPDDEQNGKPDHDALAARGYFQAFQLVKEAVARIVSGGDDAREVARGYVAWYRQLFEPMVRAGHLKAASLTGHRRIPVYLRGSGHTPPRDELVDEAMDTLFDLIADEPEHSVRAVLGHWLFGFIHPFSDGNGRTARFLMNVLLAGGGHPWTIIRVNDRVRYLDALEEASVRQDFRPFSEFIAEQVKLSYESRSTPIPSI